MAGNTYVTKGYSTYTDIPSRRGGYDYGPRKPIGYVVETTTIEHVRPTVTEYTYVGSPELLKEYDHRPNMFSEPTYGSPTQLGHNNGYGPGYGPNYGTSSPKNHHRQEEFFTTKAQPGANRPIRTIGFSGQNNYRQQSPTRYNGPEEVGDKYLNRVHHDAGQPTRTGSFSGQNNHWQSAGPPATRHPLTTPTNDINEALGFLKDVVNSPTNLGPKRGGTGGFLDDMSTRSQPIEPTRRYTRPMFGGTDNKAHYNNTTQSGSPIDSKEAMWKYRGTFVP